MEWGLESATQLKQGCTPRISKKGIEDDDEEDDHLRSYPDIKIDEIGYHRQCKGHHNSTRHENQPSSPPIHHIPPSKSISPSQEGPIRRNRAENIYYPINSCHQNGIPPDPARLLKHKRCIIRNHINPIQLRESLGAHRNQ